MGEEVTFTQKKGPKRSLKFSFEIYITSATHFNCTFPIGESDPLACPCEMISAHDEQDIHIRMVRFVSVTIVISIMSIILSWPTRARATMPKATDTSSCVLLMERFVI